VPSASPCPNLTSARSSNSGITLEPPEPPLVDDALRLVPVEPRHEAGIDALLEDETAQATRVPPSDEGE
jgi:hypothetical protein